MPPRARAKKPDEPRPDAAKPAPICPQCWPNGWPTPDTHNASCVHGVWKSE